MLPSSPPASDTLPMTVVTGYLGSGKTTLINQLLANADGRRITVLVNDFGEISLDAELIENQDGDIIALANGCMCCQIGGDLYRTIDRILSLRSKIDHLVVETSGVADPSKISQIAAAEPELEDYGTLTLVDAINFAAIHAQPVLRDTLVRQLQKADLILLTKLDTLQADELSEVIETITGIAPDCTFADSVEEVVAAMFAPGGFPLSRESRLSAEPLKLHSVPFDSWTFREKTALNRERLIALLQNDDLSIYRCKGKVIFDDGSGGVINMVGEQITVEPSIATIDQSELTVIGSKPGFSRDAFHAAWGKSGIIGGEITAKEAPRDE